MIFHQPVLLAETLAIFNVKPGQIFIDATLGHGGHTIEILKLGGVVYGLDADPKYLQIVTDRIKSLNLNANFHPLNQNFTNILDIKKTISQPVSGILFDLGLNRDQQTTSGRGFSFNDQASLDMRLNPGDDSVTAEEIINTYDFDQLVTMFSKYAQEKLSKPIAVKIIQERQQKPIRQATRLADIIKNVYQSHHLRTTHHPATQVFLALRIVVNQEFANIIQALESTLDFNSNCKVIVITFHSGEDRLVKQFIRQHDVINLTPKLIRPDFKEVKQNPLSRSSVLRSYKIV